MQIPAHWQSENNHLVRDFSFPDFQSAMSFLIRVAFVAELQNHHPEICNVYNRVKLSLTTHDAGNQVTEKDVKLAESINQLLANPF